jgi:hypothetical protein
MAFVFVMSLKSCNSLTEIELTIERMACNEWLYIISLFPFIGKNKGPKEPPSLSL